MLKPATIWLFLLVLIMTWGCKDPYVSPYRSPSTGYLVVEGYISGNTTTQFTLSRTIPLPGDTTLPTIDGASVTVVGSDNSSYPLTGMGNGIYNSIDTLILNPQLQYTLSIKTPNGEQYRSDPVPYKPTPPIDSVNWIQYGDRSIRIYVNTHNPIHDTGYYQWNFDQTFEYHSAEESNVLWDKDTTPQQILERTLQNQVYRCWTTGSSSDIIIGNSTKLASDVIYEQPVKLIPPDDVQTSVLYSILVRQYSLTAQGYDFLSLMQQNTESLGSIFDAQPSQLTGNIHCLTVPAEQVIGYVSAGTVQSQRIFISRSQIQSAYTYVCPIPDTFFPNAVLQQVYDQGQYTPVSFDQIGLIKGYLSNYTDCLDCTLHGGVNVEPSFWPN